jgi:hypothetical protein
MPKTCDSLGIHFDGPVLTGRKSVQQAQREDEIRTLANPNPGPLAESLHGKPRSLTPPGGLEPAARGILRLPGKGPRNAKYRQKK